MNPSGQKTYSPEIKAAHDAKEIYIIDFLTNMTFELVRGFAKNEKGDEFLPDRAKLVLCFTIMDVLANFWMKYKNNTYSNTSHKGPFSDWANQFCLTKNNKGYKEIKMLQKMHSENLYDLRCAIVHSYCLPQKREDTHIGILPNESSDEFIETFANKLSKKGGGNDIMLKPDYILKMIMEGSDLMMAEMIKQITTNPDFHIDGIERVYRELQRRGAASIKLDKEKITKPLE